MKSSQVSRDIKNIKQRDEPSIAKIVDPEPKKLKLITTGDSNLRDGAVDSILSDYEAQQWFTPVLQCAI